MTQDEIIEMARQAGWSGIYIVWAEPTGEVDWSPYKVSLTVPVTMEQIEAFAKLVAAKEREACAELESQEPVAWQTMEAKYPTLEKLDIRMGDGSILCNVWPQSDGDLWWEGSGTGEKFIDPKYANVTHWRVHSDTTPPQRTWVGLTEQERNDIEDYCEMMIGKPAFDAIEAKLKEKNT
jgi:hypothetical protein